MGTNFSLRPQISGEPIGWGILGTGSTAQVFASDLACEPAARLVAVGSRDKERARTFGEKFRIPNQYGSYKELVNDPRVQVIYIATPASVHRENMLLCLNAGKAVLCEKPFTVNAREAAEAIALARRKRVFLMEAMWTRFVPLIQKVRDLLASGAIGTISHFIADMGTRVPFDSQGRIFNADLGGGALLQKGIYLLSLASMILGTPNVVKSLSSVGETGVDEHTGILLGYPGSQLASLICSVRVDTERVATIVGSAGQIRIHEPIICPASLTLCRYPNRDWHREGMREARYARVGQELIQYCKRSRLVRQLRERYPKSSEQLLYGIHSKKIYAPPIGEGLHYQVSEVIRCLRAGQIESDLMPLNESLTIIDTVDQIRAQWPVRHLQDHSSQPGTVLQFPV